MQAVPSLYVPAWTVQMCVLAWQCMYMCVSARIVCVGLMWTPCICMCSCAGMGRGSGPREPILIGHVHTDMVHADNRSQRQEMRDTEMQSEMQSWYKVTEMKSRAKVGQDWASENRTD